MIEGNIPLAGKFTDVLNYYNFLYSFRNRPVTFWVELSQIQGDITQNNVPFTIYGRHFEQLTEHCVAVVVS